MVNLQSPLPRHLSDAVMEAVRGISGCRRCPSPIRTSARFPYLPLGRLLDADPAFICRRPLSHRQATSSIQESLLTMPLLEQTSMASIGPNSLDPAPRAPSPEPARPFLFRAAAPILLREPCPTMTVQSPFPTCHSLPHRRPLLDPSSQSAPSPMLSKREFSRATFTWTEPAMYGHFCC